MAPVEEEGCVDGFQQREPHALNDKTFPVSSIRATMLVQETGLVEEIIEKGYSEFLGRALGAGCS